MSGELESYQQLKRKLFIRPIIIEVKKNNQIHVFYKNNAHKHFYKKHKLDLDQKSFFIKKGSIYLKID